MISRHCQALTFDKNGRLSVKMAQLPLATGLTLAIL